MLDHVGLRVSDYARSRAFYERALAPLGISLLMEPIAEIGGFGKDGKPFFWIATRMPVAAATLHVAFAVARRATVDAFHAAGLAAGGDGQRRARRAGDLPPALLRRLRARPRRQQHRGGLPRAGGLTRRSSSD